MALPFAEEKLSRVPVLVAVPPEALDGVPAKGAVQLGLYVYVTDDKGELADYFTRLVNIDPSTDAGAQARSGLTYYGTCHLLAGRYRIRAYVRNEQTGRFGFRVVPLEIPEIREGTMTALPPIFVSRPGSGLRLRDEAANADGSPEPFLVGQTLVVPQVLPSVSAGAPSRVCLMIYQKTHTDVIQPLEIKVQIVDSAGAVTSPAKVSMVSRTKPAAMGLDKMILEFEPPTLPPGEYSLRVTFKDVADESSHTESEARFRIL
jgi:hypothetical protein